MTTVSSNGDRFIEAVAVGVFGGLLGAAAGRPFGLTIPAATFAAANGVVSGWRGVYAWRTARGAAAAVLDSTWSLPMTSAALVSHALGRRAAGRGTSSR